MCRSDVLFLLYPLQKQNHERAISKSCRETSRVLMSNPRIAWLAQLVTRDQKIKTQDYIVQISGIIDSSVEAKRFLVEVQRF